MKSFFDTEVKASEAEVNVITSHKRLGFPHLVDYSRCGLYIVASADRKLVVLNTETRGIIKELRIHADIISVVKFPSSSKIISASWDCTIAVWDWKLGILLRYSAVVTKFFLTFC